nr:nitrate regulatory gene2 protein-like [Ipomoea batatas]
MGCSSSKVDDEESVKLCKDRKKFIKEAVEYRLRFASSHIAYIQSMKRVSAALRDYVEVDEPREFLLDAFTTNQPFAPAKKVKSGGFISIEPKSFTITPLPPENNSTLRVNYLRSGGNATVSVEERPQLPETFRIETYSPVHQYGMDGFFPMQSPPVSSSIFNYSPNNRPNFPPSPQNTQWDFFWNPFASLDYYGYPTTSNLDHEILDDDDNDGLRQVREKEGIPDLEEESEQEETNYRGIAKEERARIHQKFINEVVVEDDDDDSGDNDEIDEHIDTDHHVQGLNSNSNHHAQGLNSNANHHAQGLHSNANHHVQGLNSNANHHFQGLNSNANRHVQGLKSNANHHVQGLKPNGGNHSTAVAKAQNRGQLSSKGTAVVDCEAKEEAPGFTVYVNRRPTSMAEVIKDLETQFTIACNSATEVSSILESIRAQYSSTSNDLKRTFTSCRLFSFLFSWCCFVSFIKFLWLNSFFEQRSSRSSSSRFLINPSTLKDECYQSNSDTSDDSSMLSSSHQSTLDRLFVWEKKLYQEVRAGERVRLAYEKKCAQLRNQDVSGADPSSLEKTRAAIRDLHTQIKVSIHSVESISKRIESLRDDELQPQLLQLVEGLGKMWKVMAECHHIQKRTLDDAKLLLAGMPSKHAGIKKYTIMSPSEPHQLARSAANLEMELRNWRACFESWITSQRSYLHALTGWLLRCLHEDPDTSSKTPCSPRRTEGAPPIFNICIQWSKLLDSVRELPVLDGLDFFAAGVGSLYAHQLKEDSRGRNPGGSKRFSGEPSSNKMELVEVGKVDEEVMTAEKMAEVAIRVLCAGMSVSVSSLTEFSIVSAEGYADLLKNWEEKRLLQNSNGNGM